MHQILADLVAEQQAVDQFLQTVKDRDWKTKTAAPGWDVRDQVSHLAFFEEYAYNALEEGGSRLGEATEYDSFDDFTHAGALKGRQLRPQEAIEWWRGSRAKVVDALSRTSPAKRIPWFLGDMSAKSFATARQMETWAHGLDIHDSFDSEPEDTVRLKNIAWLGWKTLPYAFELAGEEYSEQVRLELIGPNYAKWLYGPEHSSQVIRGRAGDWCRVAVRRRSAGLTSLVAEGKVAEMALLVARAYA